MQHNQTDSADSELRFLVCKSTPIRRSMRRLGPDAQTMNPDDPESAHRIVADYARVLEEGDAQAFPASVRNLPYPKQTIKSAILTCATALRETQQLTAEMHAFLEEAYAALADYVDDDLVRVMREYRESLAVVADVQAARDKLHTPAWQRIAETSRMAGEIAKSIAEDTAVLRLEFRAGAGGAAV